MGRRTEESYDDELLAKFKQLFEEIYEKMKKENPESAVSFEDFVQCLDVKDKMTKKLFECIIKESVASTRTGNQDQNRSESTSQRTTAIVFSTPLSSLFGSGNGPTIALLPASFLTRSSEQ